MNVHEFFTGLSQLLLSKNGVLSVVDDLHYLIFATGCGIMGALVVVLDGLILFATRKSFLNIAHGFPTSLRYITAWSIGAAIGGYIGAAFGILQVTRIACVVAGAGWPLILPILIKYVQQALIKEDEQEA